MSRASDKDEKQAGGGAATTGMNLDFAPLPRATKSALFAAVEAQEVSQGGASHLHPYLFSKHAKGFVNTRLASRANSALFNNSDTDCSQGSDASGSGSGLSRSDTVVLPFVPASTVSATAPPQLKIGTTNTASAVSEDAVTPTNASASQPAWGYQSNLGVHRLSDSAAVTLMMGAKKPKGAEAKRSMSDGAKPAAPLAPLTFQS